MKTNETYYELLKIQPNATLAEIANAYHSARNAFSKDSIASYSLFSHDEADVFLKQLEEAYMTLSNLDRKREYDRKLNLDPASVAPAQAPAQATLATAAPTPVASPAPTPVLSTAEPLEPSGPGSTINGAWLRQARVARGMSIEDVSRLTKIPLRTLKAIEDDDLPKMPARVYLQGFVNNLTKVYRVELASTKAYLENVDRLLKPTP